MLAAHSLTIGYRPNRQPATIIAEKLDLTLQAGQLVCLLGPNGAGKSTLMRTLAGMQPPLAGHVTIDAESVSDMRPRELAKRLSIVLTERIDAGLLSGYSLVALGRYPYTDWRGNLRPEDERIVAEAIAMVGAQSLAKRPVIELSDGERQKIMIARALAQEPAVILLDEPTAYLDLPRRVEIMQILRRLAHERGKAILLSTHDLDLALRNADEIWLMTAGQLHTGAPEDLVLDGVFAQAFASEGVQFDTAEGAFRVRAAERGRIALIDQCDDPVRLIWTTRALERVGFQVGTDAAETIICQPDSWQYRQQTYQLLADLLRSIA